MGFSSKIIALECTVQGEVQLLLGSTMKRLLLVLCILFTASLSSKTIIIDKQHHIVYRTLQHNKHKNIIVLWTKHPMITTEGFFIVVDNKHGNVILKELRRYPDIKMWWCEKTGDLCYKTPGEQTIWLRTEYHIKNYLGKLLANSKQVSK